MTTLDAALHRLAATLPPGSNFEFVTAPGALHLDRLYVPAGHRGAGTGFLASVLAAADRAGIATELAADPTDEPGDPCTFELARWYARLGFAVTGVDGNDWVTMRRDPRPYGGPEAVLAAYAEAKATSDLTQAGFDAALDSLAPGLRPS